MNTQEKTVTRDRDGNRERACKPGTCNTYDTGTSNQKTLNLYNCHNLVILITQSTNMGNY